MGESGEEEISESGEEVFARVLGKAGAFCGLFLFAVILAVAACAILNLMGNESEILSAIQHYGPGVASVLGVVSSASTYYGWFRILRRKKKLSKKEEAKGEAQGQFTDFIQALPELFKSIGCFPQLTTAALGVSMAASAVVYTPLAETVKPFMQEKIKPYLQEITKPKPPPPPKKTIEEPPPKAEEAAAKFIHLMDITGKLYTRETHMLGLGIRGGARGTVELLRDGAVVATTQTNLEGGYAFIGVPEGKYKVRATMDGYRQAAMQIGYDIKMEPEDKEMYKQDPFMAGLLELVKMIESPDIDFKRKTTPSKPGPAPAPNAVPPLLAEQPQTAPVAIAAPPAAIAEPPAAIVVVPPESVVLPPMIATAIDPPIQPSAGFWNVRNALRLAALGLSATSLGMGLYYNNQADTKKRYLQEYRDAATITGEENYGDAHRKFHNMQNSVDNTRTLRDGFYIGAGAFGAAGAATFVF